MLEFLKNILIVIIGFVSSYIIFPLLKNVFGFINDFFKDKRSFKNNRALQVESFFRSNNNNNQEEILNQWSKKLLLDETTDIEQYLLLIKDTVVYSSEKSIIILELTAQFIYQNSNIKEYADKEKTILTNERKVYNAILLVYIAFIISSLKNDFSGYNVSPTQLLKLKINDYYNSEKFFNDTVKLIYKKIKQEK